MPACIVISEILTVKHAGYNFSRLLVPHDPGGGGRSTTKLRSRRASHRGPELVGASCLEAPRSIADLPRITHWRGETVDLLLRDPLSGTDILAPSVCFPYRVDSLAKYEDRGYSAKYYACRHTFLEK